MTEKIFLNYRHDDASSTLGRLCERLIAKFGVSEVFIDVDKIPDGVVITEEVKAKARNCKVILVVIGPHWTSITSKDGRRRLDHPKDSVRSEIVAAFAGGARVIPVLIDGAKPPAAKELPKELRALADLKARELRHNQFDSDAKLLIDEIRRVLTSKKGWILLTVTAAAALWMGLSLPGYLTPSLSEVTSEASSSARTIKAAACHSLAISNNRHPDSSNFFNMEIRRESGAVEKATKDQPGGTNLNWRLIPISESRAIKIQARACRAFSCELPMANAAVKDEGLSNKEIWFVHAGGAISAGFNLRVKIEAQRDHWCSWFWWSQRWRVS